MEWEEIVEKHSPKKIEYKSLKKKECVCINPIVKEKSFNEEIELDYDNIGHIYTYNKKQLKSVTEYLKKFYQPFKLELVARACAKKWGVEPQPVVDLWDSNGKVSAEFGTAIHDALEHYENFQKLGAEISKVRDVEENYALPKHPLLRKIVLEFIEINPYGCCVETEILITDIENGLAGRADRLLVLDKKKKICRVGDYKINIGSEKKDNNHKPLAPFNELPANKISKYQIQMSIYANMLTKSGWEVEGLDVFIYEDEWKHFKLDVLEVLE